MQRQFEPGTNALLPAYACPSVVLPFRLAGLEVRFYDVLRDFTPDLDSMGRLADERTRLALVIHYFGFPQDVALVRGALGFGELEVWEDCAHSLLSKLGTRELGRDADVSVFSLKKSLPVLDGAIAVARKNGGEGPVDRMPLPRGQVLKLWLSALEGMAGFSLRTQLLRFKGVRATAYRATEEWDGACGKSLSQASEWIWSKLDPKEVGEARRAHYLGYLDELCDVSSARLPFDRLPEGVVPLGFPVLVPRRAAVLDRLLRSFVNARVYWDALPDRAAEGAAVARELSEQIIVLPVHQSLTERQRKRAVRVFRRALEQAVDH